MYATCNHVINAGADLQVWCGRIPGAAEAVGRSLQLSHLVVLDSAGASSFGCGAGSNGRHLVTMACMAQALVREIFVQR